MESEKRVLPDRVQCMYNNIAHHNSRDNNLVIWFNT